MTKPIHFAGTNHVTPERDSKGWGRVIARGCGGDVYYGQDGADYYCRHEYGWTCDDCPICIESMDKEQEKWENEVKLLQGPPRRHPPEKWQTEIWWMNPEVATELYWLKEEA